MRRALLVIGPGMLVAATGVGAGDLATASFTGSRLGTAVLWAVVVGGFFKFVLNEGLTRWQLATGETLLEGTRRLGRPIGWLFLPYLFLWTFFVASALMSACGVTLHAMIPAFADAADGKVAFGILSSLVGLGLVAVGGFALFEKVMSVCIAVMFGTVLVTAAFLNPGLGEVLRGLFVPSIPHAGGEGITWTVALVGGVGGTLTVLCYGYWIREKGRVGTDDLATCRIDLGVAYAMTVVFGIAMVIIGTTLRIEGTGAGLLVALADSLENSLGLWGRWFFLLGAFGAVFSSLLGVWQSVPYLFGDIWRLFIQQSDPAVREPGATVDTRSTPYRAYLLAIAIVPMLGLFMSFREIQKLYAVIGAMFIPMLALVLLVLNGRRDWVGAHVNKRSTVAALTAAIAFFGWMAWRSWTG